VPLYGKTNKGTRIPQAKLLHNIAAMGVNGTAADKKFIGNLLTR
jgi:hypothetical protein